MHVRFVGLALGTLLLASCGGGAAAPGPAGSSAAPATASSAAAKSAAPASKPAAPASSKPAASASGTFDGTLLVGTPLSTTGSLANEGKLTQQGYDLWADVVNSKGGIKVGDKHYKVQIKFYDDQSKQDQAALLTDKLITQDKVSFLLSPYGTASTFAASAIAEKAKMPMVDSNGAANSIFNRKFKYTFGVLSTADKYLTGVVQDWLEQNPKPQKLAILAANDAFSLEVADGAKKFAESHGLPVVYDQSYPANTKDLSSALEQIKAAGADALLGSGHLDDSLVLMKQVKSLGLNFKGIGLSVGPSTPEFTKALGKDGDYVFSGVQWVPDQKSTGPVLGSASDYAQAFQKKYGIIPEYHSADGAA
ncbi:MAG: amino acid ABC transporter substrate-binding protein, partial [Chloroflexota bacterium]|nr:amino acid ABC transporter substrate-binding protein [Chloroflexota bacterium]